MNKPKDNFMSRSLLAIFTIFILPGCALLQDDLVAPNVSLVSIAPEKIGFGGIELLCTLDIENPNEVAIPISGARFALAIDGSELAQGAVKDKFRVPAFGSTRVDIRVQVDSRRAIALALGILNSGATELAYSLNGYVDVGLAVLGRVRIRENGVVPLTSEPARRSGTGGI